MKKYTVLSVVILFSILFSMQSVQACSITASGKCGGATCPTGEKCKKVSDFECKCVKEKGAGADTIQQTQTDEMQKKQADEGAKGAAIKQGCCYKKKNSTCMCSAPVLKKDCPSDYTWKEGKNCYESDKTGCCD